MKKILILVTIAMMTLTLVNCGSNDAKIDSNKKTTTESSKDSSNKKDTTKKDTDKNEGSTINENEDASNDNNKQSSSSDNSNDNTDNTSTDTEIDQNDSGVQAALAKLILVNGEVDSTTGNTFSYYCESIVKIDGVEYYNFRTSWLVLDESGTSHLSYLTNYVVSKDLSKVGEYYGGQLYLK